MIVAGDKSQIEWADGNWAFLDVGFANLRRSCGFAFSDKPPICLTFAEARKRLLEELTRSKTPFNLVIEAPLSVCFDPAGNPKGRLIEREDKKSRFWYVGPGCAVMVAAIYLIRAISEIQPVIPVRLFEGFVSFKDKGVRASHQEDVSRLRQIVRDSAQFSDSIYTSAQLSEPPDRLCSAFKVAGVDCGIPPIIKVGPISR
jgi:hypothetical protein